MTSSSSSIETVEDLFRGRFEVPSDASGVLFRLAASLRSGGPSRDALVLLRQVLLHESERHGLPPAVRAPRSLAELPLEACGLEYLDTGSELTLRAGPWNPEWLDYPEHLSAAFAEAPRRDELPTEDPDPFVSAVGYSRYQSEGQKGAVRAALTAPPGSTLVIGLPTGSGKSMVSRAVALLRDAFPGPHGTTVVVVPTVSLALDQARALTESGLVRSPCAYVGGGAENEGIRARIIAGSQPIVFASPESACGSLRPVLYAAAERGLVRALIIDEAHLVDHWGDSFRPQFQQLAGIRRGLIRACTQPESVLRTYLLSATFSSSSLATLETLFGWPGPFKQVSSQFLRPEPAYWSCHCVTEAVRQERVLEALDHLPRPLILYTTRVDDAKAWHETIKQRGYSRVGLITGESSTKGRQLLVEDWAARRVDIVVATAAFGVGVDQQEVRTVIHACVPESLDRLYQEVGRGGRDGNASLSLMLYTTRDLAVARDMARLRTISVERGLDRWTQMFQRKLETLDADKFVVNLTRQPSLRGADLERQSAKNEIWNASTLTLMARANLIDLEDQPMASRSDEKPDFKQAVVRVKTSHHLDPEEWAQHVERARRQTADEGARQMRLIEEMLKAKKCISHLLSEAYEIGGATPARACGGCAWCRKHNVTPFMFPPQVTEWPWPYQSSVRGAALRLLRGGRSAVIQAPSGEGLEERRARERLLRRCAESGFVLIVSDEDAAMELDGVVFVDQARNRKSPRLPTLLFQPRSEVLPRRWSELLRGDLANDVGELLFVLSEDVRDGDTGRQLKETYAVPTTTLSGFQAMEEY